jgi:type III pantothenate kinase
MANLVIDIGNTFTKIAVFTGDELRQAVHHKRLSPEIINTLLTDHSVDKAIISSVKKTAEDWEGVLQGTLPVTYFNSGMTPGIINRYHTPDTLGLDRLAAAIGAHYLYPGRDNLIIDAGTCITYDWVDSGGNYFGGSISPGLNMRYKSLNNYTAALPLIEPDSTFVDKQGTDTQSSMLSGVQNGIKYELTGFINSYKKDGLDMNIILTGGDSIFFDTLLKNSIFAPYIENDPYLVLKGLNAAIQNNND